MTNNDTIFKIEIKPDNTECLEKEVLEEIWADIPSEFTLSNYEISNIGRLKNKKTGYISNLKPRKDTGRNQFSLVTDDKKQKTFFGNVLVCRSFIPNLYNKNVVDHINRNKSDDRLSNLRHASNSENSKNKIFNYKRGKKVEQYDLNGNLLKIWDKIADVEKDLKINHSNILAVINGRKKSTNGFAWKYNIEYIKGEIWKKVLMPEIEDTYVSNYGRIKRRNEDHTITYGSPKGDGYYSVCIPIKSSIEETKITRERIKTKQFQVHRLIAQTFIKNPDNKLIVTHIDGDKGNNKVENLEWSTNSENINHRLNLKNICEYKFLQIDTKSRNLTNKINNTYFDKIVKIEYINEENKFVYDLTVEDTRNFQLFNGLNIRDTLKIG